MLAPLPIDDVLPELLTRLRGATSLVLRAPTGAGKTTRVPPAVLDAGLAGDRQVILLQPRRVAARAAALRMSDERGTPLGELIGYQVRFERRASRATRILVATEGVFLRLLQDDPFIESVGLVIFDEFHERNLNTDLALAMVRRVQTTVRPDLRAIVMSATLDPAPIARYLDNCPSIESQGRTYPVDVDYTTVESRDPIPVQVARGVTELWQRTSGDVLAFLPGVGEIRRTGDELSQSLDTRACDLMELYADLPLEKQQAVLLPSSRRKIVLATNVAETSVTIAGVTGVVDSGFARQLSFDATLGLNRLELKRISKAAADQRAGRAGRTAPGVCLRLWTAQQQRSLAERETPDIERVDLAGPVLELLAWGESDVQALPWFEPPPNERVEQALQLLQRLGALAAGQITTLGRRMVRLPVHPRLARLMLEGARFGHGDAAALLAALLSERDPFRRGDRRGPRLAEHASDSDVLDRLHAFADFERSGRRDSPVGSLDSGSARFTLRARDQLARLLREESSLEKSTRADKQDRCDEDQALLRALLAAFPDRLARRREAGSRRAVMVGGRGVKLADESAVLEPELFVGVEAEETGRSESLVRQASAVDRAWLDPQQLHVQVEVEFDPKRGRVVAWRRTRFADLVIDEAATNLPADSDAATILAREAAERLNLNECFETEELNYLNRVRSLAGWMPQLELPDLTTDPWPRLLPALCEGCVSLDDVKRASVTDAVRRLLTHQQIQAVEREAPERVQVPSGSAIRLTYEPGKPPVLAVRIQEVFGLRQTPRVAGGRVPVLLHLLAPNYRPQQVTQDLASFWANTYPEVKKELKRRYPKHAWPDDPLTAQAERRPGKRDS
ncbi:MAG: ATP-dependent helicase HrpB [Planctomycetaceae bacterium]|nr:ATP-dependent helicase HrpB [Planctomycetaceae bacterium]